MKQLALVLILTIALAVSASATDTVVFNFTSATGFRPNGPLFLAPDSKYYGVLAGDTSSSKGAVFQYNSATATTTTIFDFTGNPSGLDLPSGTIYVDSALNVYGVVTGTGLIGERFGAVYRLNCLSGGLACSKTTTANVWTLQVAHQFVSTDGASPIGGLVIDPSGAFYGTTAAGGSSATCSNGCGVLFKLAKSGTNFTFVVLHNFTSTEGSSSQASLTCGSFVNYDNTSQCHLFGTSRSSGAHGLAQCGNIP